MPRRSPMPIPMPISMSNDTMSSSMDAQQQKKLYNDKVAALEKMHNLKVRALQKSLKTLQDQVQYFKSSSKEHRRSALIQQLRSAVKENEEIVDVLKQRLVDTGQPVMAVNELIVKKTCAGPKRFRPKTREELQIDADKMTKENLRLRKQLEKLRAAAAQRAKVRM